MFQMRQPLWREPLYRCKLVRSLCLSQCLMRVGGDVPFRYPLSREMRQSLDELRILEQKQAAAIFPQLQG